MRRRIDAISAWASEYVELHAGPGREHLPYRGMEAHLRLRGVVISKSSIGRYGRRKVLEQLRPAKGGGADAG